MADVTIGKGNHAGKGDIALRPIKKGEAITIDNAVELQHELDTFLKAYEQAANSCDFVNVAPFIASDATFWFTNGRYVGKQQIQQAFEHTWETIKHETYTISNVSWPAKSYWAAACTYSFTSDGIVNGQRQVYKGQGTNVLVRIQGNWGIVHEHLSMAL